ncbi:glycosyltransferase family 4 protein [Lacticaseibacillus rhamnosus]|uniref:glycosyltransferase family 4 protein n=1 Tax=Lacticaseibacillus rhamnosus TaxID=47715 RepID=UPI0028157CA3|nr:glycosyltransferase family 4 protein [Lacticaseibacillus rhamnosus]
MKVNFLMRMHDDTPSGGRAIVYDYANFLVERGHAVTITFLADASYPLRKHDKLSSVDHVIKYIRGKKKQNKITWHFINKKILIKVLFSYNPKRDRQKGEKVIAFDYGIALHLAKFFKKFDDGLFYFIQADEKIYYDEAVVRSAWALPIQKITISHYLKAKIEVWNRNVIVVQNYVNFNNFFLTKKINDRKPVISILNHSAVYKNTKMGIDALKIVKRENPDLFFKVIMFGNPPAPKVKDFSIKYYQHASPNTLREKVYNKSSVFLSTSNDEGWGLTAMEAMACGAALISTRNGGVLDFAKNGESALLTPVNDSRKMAEQIRRLLRDNALRNTIARNGHMAVQGFSFEKSAHKFELVLMGKLRS